MGAIGDRLRDLRLRRGLTQVQLGELLGLDQTTVSGVEAMNRVTTTKTLEAWIAVCGGSLSISGPGPAEALDQLTDEERAMVEAARRIPEAERQLVVDVIRAWPRLDPFQRSVFALAAKNEADDADKRR